MSSIYKIEEGKLVKMNESDSSTVLKENAEKLVKIIDDVFDESLRGFKGVNSVNALNKVFKDSADYINKEFARVGLKLSYDEKDKGFRKQMAHLLLSKHANKVASDDVKKELKKYS